MNAIPLDADACYRASAGRDRRFDGQFVMAVRTTGIYCKPSCPARMPRPANVEFYRTSAAAHLAGFRACKRCLPEAVPGSPEWAIREDVAARAMRLIGDGVVDREGVPGLAARVGYSGRQLGRVLSEELGAGALALARAQRAQTARTLLVSTAMPASDVAFAAGFASIRQFNDTVAEVFGMTPTQVRAAARRVDRLANAGAARSGVARSGVARSGAAEPGVARSGVAYPGAAFRSAGTPAPQGAAAGLDKPADSPGSGTSAHRGTAAITVRLAAREPFDGAGVLKWLATRAIPGIESVQDGAYTRSVRLAGGMGVVSVTPEPGAVSVTARLADLADLPSLLARVRRLFDLDADPAMYEAALAADPRMAASIATTRGIRIPGALDPVEMVVRAILGQQVTVAAARTAVRRLVAELAEPLPPALAPMPLEVTHLFPTAATLASAVRDVVTGPGRRREALALACEAAASGELPLDVGATRDELTSVLEAIPGIGPWTSNYVALRVLGSPDLLLTGDIAVRNGAAALGLPRDAKPLSEAAAAFAPWRSYLMMHLWRAAASPVSAPPTSSPTARPARPARPTAPRTPAPRTPAP
ncbi:AlkA N-terminal domain-containing protein [Demequina lutea]|uniref:DNA-3-methyladenine glycosylase II n=1 Tax=Demequina lutea TaxID=431489 RepID=A0A7Y9ZFT3_9MICO|nr:AlkA N-terminal domain-containing protein [Demequina lutea]NYI42581.1 AraC family transcriptional regulator of adaptative response / DNA-3-methyladenine glycosylase II [Demequina lutea]